MTNQTSPADTVRALYDAFKSQDLDRLLALMHPEIEWNQMPGFPGGGRWRGAEQVFENVFQPLQERWTGFGTQIDEIHSDGNTVVALGKYVGTFNATGHSIEVGVAHVYRVEDGKVTRLDQYTDTAVIAQAVCANG